MLYLAGQFAWFLLAALGLGCVMGWVAQSTRKVRFWSPAWTWVAVLWGIAAVLVWFQLVNGRTATWVETALLFVGAYWLGCAAGALAGSAMLARPAPPNAAQATASRIEPEAAVSAPTAPEPVAQGSVEERKEPHLPSKTAPGPDAPAMDLPGAESEEGAERKPAAKPAAAKRRKPKA